MECPTNPVEILFLGTACISFSILCITVAVKVVKGSNLKRSRGKKKYITHAEKRE